MYRYTYAVPLPMHHSFYAIIDVSKYNNPQDSQDTECKMIFTKEAQDAPKVTILPLTLWQNLDHH